MLLAAFLALPVHKTPLLFTTERINIQEQRSGYAIHAQCTTQSKKLYTVVVPLTSILPSVCSFDVCQVSKPFPSINNVSDKWNIP